jgi:hypothetical protein
MQLLHRAQPCIDIAPPVAQYGEPCQIFVPVKVFTAADMELDSGAVRLHLVYYMRTGLDGKGRHRVHGIQQQADEQTPQSEKGFAQDNHCLYTDITR